MKERNISRRTLIKGAGATAAAATGVGAVLLGGAGTAAATANGTIGSASVTSDDGVVKNVNIKTTGRMVYDGLDSPAQYFRIRVYLSAEDGGGNTVVSETNIHDTQKIEFPASPGDWGGAGEYAEGGNDGTIASDTNWYVVQEDGSSPGPDGQGLPSNPADNDPFTVGTDGSSSSYTITIRSRYDLYKSDGSAITGSGTNLGVVESTGDIDLTVNNQEATASFGGKDAQGDGSDSAGANTPEQD